jgi:phosphoribosylformylglycinamidine synthase subunit PurS
MIGARVHVVLKRSVLDPQGGAVLRSLQALGHEDVQDVRVGRLVELVLDIDDEGLARERVASMCEELLVNGVVETYDIELVDARLVGGLREVGACA